MKNSILFFHKYIGGGLLILILMGSCDNGFFNAVGRSSSEPLPSTPRVSSFNSIYGVPISWDVDALADSYILYRKLLPSGTNTIVYSGHATEYMDTEVANKSIYKYTLSKVRGSKEFPVGSAAYGAFDNTYIKDPLGNNDSLDKALELSTFTVEDRIFYYSDLFGVVLEDRDWYYMDVAPGWVAEIKVTYSYENSSQIPAYIYVDTNQLLTVPTSGVFMLRNGTNKVQRMYFCVHTNTSIVGLGATFTLDYLLNLNSLTILQP